MFEIMGLIDATKFFVLHAPRQTGKTTGLLTLRNHLNKEGKYSALYVNNEGAQAAREIVRGEAVLAYSGLIKRQSNIKISNSIYSEVIPRELSLSRR